MTETWAEMYLDVWQKGRVVRPKESIVLLWKCRAQQACRR
jgi:hypothetical protein